MIQLSNLHKYYTSAGLEPLHVLKGLDMYVKKNEYVSIMGSSGSGKSTLLNILGILDAYDGGSYMLDDKLIDRKLSETEASYLRNAYIGFVFQSFNLLHFKDAIENVALPLYYRGVPRKKRNEIASLYLEKVGLYNRRHHYPSQLSGGQKQRVAIARAMVGNPKLILADEPTGALDTQTSHDIMELFDQLHSQGMTIILVTHEKDIAERTQRTIWLKDGQIFSDTYK